MSFSLPAGMGVHRDSPNRARNTSSGQPDKAGDRLCYHGHGAFGTHCAGPVLIEATATVLASLRADGGSHRRHPRVVTSWQYSRLALANDYPLRLDGLLKLPAVSRSRLSGVNIVTSGAGGNDVYSSKDSDNPSLAGPVMRKRKLFYSK